MKKKKFYFEKEFRKKILKEHKEKYTDNRTEKPSTRRTERHGQKGRQTKTRHRDAEIYPAKHRDPKRQRKTHRDKHQDILTRINYGNVIYYHFLKISNLWNCDAICLLRGMDDRYLIDPLLHLTEDWCIIR